MVTSRFLSFEAASRSYKYTPWFCIVSAASLSVRYGVGPVDQGQLSRIHAYIRDIVGTTVNSDFKCHGHNCRKQVYIYDPRIPMLHAASVLV